MRYGHVAVALVGGVACGLLLSRGPWKEFEANRQRADAQRAELMRLDAKKAELLRRTARLDTPLGLEMEARRSGYRKANEERISGL